jgi:hypothetical protein
MITACGGGGGDSPGSGELAIDITDAKPVLPEGATNLWVTFSEVLVHKSGGGGWKSLPLTGDLPSNTIDLLQFYNGHTTELVPPVILVSGKYTQIRLVVSKAEIRFDNNDDKKYPVVIPPEHLKTDKNIDFDVENGGAVDILIDFDLSQSLVVTDDGSGTLSYKLKPVLHIVDASEAATISGNIAQGSFAGKNAIVTVFYNNLDPASPGEDKYEEYTKVEVSESGIDPTTEFSIFWLVPNKDFDPPRGDYRVEIDFDQDGTFYFEQFGIYLGIGDIFYLKDGDPI